MIIYYIRLWIIVVNFQTETYLTLNQLPTIHMEEYIKLDQFLKLAQVVQSGGEAKQLIRSGFITVNGEVETRRGRKLYHGDVVEFEGDEMVVEVE